MTKEDFARWWKQFRNVNISFVTLIEASNDEDTTTKK